MAKDKFAVILEGQQDVILEVQECHLARLWRLILADLTLPFWRWDALLSTHVQSYSEDPSYEDVIHSKGNLSNALAKTSITWARFTEALAILNYAKTSVRFQLTTEEAEFDVTVDIETFRQLHEKGEHFGPEVLQRNSCKLTTVWDTINQELVEKTGRPWRKHLSEYAKTVFELQDPENSKTESSIRSGINKNLDRPNITWSTFTSVMDVLKTTRLILTVQLEWETRKVKTVLDVGG